jgi:asparagine synthase (glutamine-hydrolysing)
MCGICGVVQIGGSARPVVEPRVLDRMTDLMTHRGPNDRGTLLEPGIAIGVRRLSIIDVAGGHQPFSNESGTIWAAQNGELYNHVELRSRLEAEGHRLLSQCDTEILPHVYERDGLDFPKRLRGKFGIVVWDSERRTAVLARDRLGVKPLYWARSGDVVVFASELKSVLASGLVGAELDYEAIDAYLTFGFFPGPRTPLAGVRKLMPGCRLIVDEHGAREEVYWSYPHPNPERRSVDEHAEGLMAQLDEAVRVRLMSDVPLGAMLSGGLDSSLIVALMAGHTTEPVKTFSVGFAEDGDLNELADAQLVANLFGTEHHALELSMAETEVDLAELVWQLDEPLADLSALGFAALSELASRHITVALSGQGADELLGGYAKHRAAALTEIWTRVPRPLRAAGSRVALRGHGRIARATRTLNSPDSVERLLAMSGRLDSETRRTLLRGPLAALNGEAARQVVLSRANGFTAGALAETLFIDAQLALVDDMLHYFDRASMAHSLEVRVPFLDHHVVEYCATIPSALKVRRQTTKYLLKRGARGILPDEIVNKRKIGFFAASVERWFQTQTDGITSDYLLAPDMRSAEFLDPVAVTDLVRRHRAGRGGSDARLLLSILMLEIWLSTYLPRAFETTRATASSVAVGA